MSLESASNRLDRYRGLMVGTAVGDRPGGPTEGALQPNLAYIDEIHQPLADRPHAAHESDS